jgi:predicted O-methyltransferase YrrM
MNAEQYRSVGDRLMLEKALPVTPDWSAAPDFLHCIVDYCLEHRPVTIVECSSGLTTLVLARCCQINDIGHVYSLENGEDFAAATSAVLEEFGLDQYVSVVHAPLEGVALHGIEYSWYSRHRLAVESVDMLVIDGPPGFIQRHSRYPALPLLYECLADGCVVFLDDAAREDEREIVQLWLDEFADLDHEYAGLERGCSILRRRLR